MWSTAFQITNKAVFFVFILIFSVSCNNGAGDFESRCQGGSDEYPLSNEIYKQLKKHHFERYIAIKTGSDRGGSYNFYFLGEMAESGMLIRANAVSLTIGYLTISELNKAFRLLPENMSLLHDYIDSGETMSHLSCGYMKVNVSGINRSMSFYNYIYETSLEEPVSHLGVATMVRIENYFRNILLENNDSRIFNEKTIAVSFIPQPNDGEIKKLKKRISDDPVFYELP